MPTKVRGGFGGSVLLFFFVYIGQPDFGWFLVQRKVGLLHNKKNGDCEDRVHHTGMHRSGSIF